MVRPSLAIYLLSLVPLASGADEPPFLIESFEVGRDVYVRALEIDETRNALWVGTSVGALEIDLDERSVRDVLTREDGLANEYVFAIGTAPDGAVWFGTNAGGTSRLNVDGAWRTWFPMHGLADYWVYAFAFPDEEKVWIGTWDGASLYDKATDAFTTYRDELINIWVYGLDIDDDGRIWFGTEGGVSMLDGDVWHAWTHADGLGAPNRDGREASDNTGLGTRSRHDLSTLSTTGETFNENYIFAVLVDNRDRGIWFGTWGGGLSLLDPGTGFTNVTSDDGLAGDIVYSIAQEPDGTLWLGTNHGASRWDGEQWWTYGSAQGLLDENVYAIAIEGSGDVWLGTKGGVTRLGTKEQ